jgi:hypothetical protein
MKVTILKGHTSMATAYVVDDYPYRSRLRCKIRYWLEFKPRNGFRLVSQTTNPKRAGEVWNKPKASTYCSFAVMTLNDDNGHVSWSGLNAAYSDATECKAWLDMWGEGLDDGARAQLGAIVKAKSVYEQKRKEAAGDRPTHELDLGVGLEEARKAWVDETLANDPIFAKKE